MPPPPPADGFPWTAAQRHVIILFLSLFALFLVGRYACHRQFLDDPEPDEGPRAAELAQRLDPNSASWQDLAAITGLGEKKARAVVAFRENWRLAHPRQPAFRRLEDLQQISGIGPATAKNMQPYLIFPGANGQPASTASSPGDPGLAPDDDDPSMRLP